MGIKGLIKLLAVGAVVGAVGNKVLSDKKHANKKRALQKAAHDVIGRVSSSAKKLSKMTKTSFNTIVDTTLAEYRDMKDLSDEELSELKRELKDNWGDIRDHLKKKPPAKKGGTKRKAAPKKGGRKS